jgi:hypothetical protein
MQGSQAQAHAHSLSIIYGVVSPSATSSARQGTLIASRADGVPGLAQAVLGTRFLGAGLLLHKERQQHGRCHTSVSSGARTYRRQPLERVPITWNHGIEKDSLKFKELEHVLIEKVEQLFRDML